MFNFRQLAVLIVSVFISLGLGIAVGFSANSDILLVKQQKITIDNLEKDFNILKAKNKQKEWDLTEASARNTTNLGALDDMFEILFRGILSDENIVVVGFDEDYPSRIKECLNVSGAHISTFSIKQIINSFDDLSPTASFGCPLDNETSVFAGNRTKTEVFNRIAEFEPAPDIFIIICDDITVDECFLTKDLSDMNIPVAVIQTSSESGFGNVGDLDRFVNIYDMDNALGKYRLMSFILGNMNKD